MSNDGFTLSTFSQLGEKYNKQYFQEHLVLGVRDMENLYLKSIRLAEEEDAKFIKERAWPKENQS